MAALEPALGESCDVDREMYLERLAHYREKFDFRLLAFCQMTNHVHLALRAGRFPLSRFMAGLQSSYTQWFNRRHKRVGHLFQGRYKAFLVQEEPYLLALVRYIHENPKGARLGLVEQAGDYVWEKLEKLGSVLKCCIFGWGGNGGKRGQS